MPDRDASQEALRQVQDVTDSEPMDGEELLGSPELRRQLRDPKERLKRESSEPSGQEPVD